MNYTYDAVGRLSAASTTGTEWGLSFTYDGFGNKTAQTVTKGSAPAMSVGVDGNNRVVGWTYDAAGFPTAVSGQYSSIGWDAQGRMQGISVQGGSVDGFVYDPGNHRVWRNNQLHLRGLDGKVVGLFNFNTSTETFSLVTTYAWFAGRKVGQKIDRLGTVQNGSRFYPYGEESASTGNDTEKFATYWRDSNTGLDYAVNRYYKANIGRFMSPDPYPGSATAARSGSWNRFTYVEGDPINKFDPVGLDVYDPDFDGPMSMGDIARMSAMNTFENEQLPSYAGPGISSPGEGGGGQELDLSWFWYNPWGPQTPNLMWDYSYIAVPGSEQEGRIPLRRQAGNFEEAEDHLHRALNYIRANNAGRNCNDTLANLGLDWQRIQQRAEQVVLLNGVNSMVTRRELYQHDPDLQGLLGAGGNTTVGQIMAGGNTAAVAELGGNRIFINPSFVGADVRNRDMFTNGAMMVHEMLHTLSAPNLRLTDSDIQGRLGLVQNQGSVNISNRIHRDCF